MDGITKSHHFNKLKRSPMIITSLVIFVSLLLQPVLNAQDGHPWSQNYGGSGSETAYDILQTEDGGFISVGASSSFGDGTYDLWLLRTDANGDSLWSKNYGGAGYDYGNAIQPTNDGGYVVAGRTSSFGAGDYDIWLLKFNALGDTLWTQTYGGTSTDQANGVIQTDDGGYLISGITSSFGAGSYDAWLVKTDENGNAVWTETYGGSGYDYAWRAVSTNDGGYVFFGVTSSFGAGGYDDWLVKTDSNGDVLWDRTYGRASDDIAITGTRANDGGYVLAGYAIPEGGSGYDFWVLKTNAFGDSLWANYYGRPVDSDYAYDVKPTIDGGIVIGGTSYSGDTGLSDYMLVKVDENGNAQFTQKYGSGNSDQCQGIQQTNDGGFILTGYGNPDGTDSDFWLVRTEPDPILGLRAFYDGTNGDGWSDNTNWWDGSTTADN